MINVKALLANVVTVEIYPDVVAEGAIRPAISYVNIANPFSRNLEGNKTKKFSSWRVTIEASTLTQLSDIIEQVESLDNTAQYGFSHIYANLLFIEPKDELAPYRRAFIDLTLY